MTPPTWYYLYFHYPLQLIGIPMLKIIGIIAIVMTMVAYAVYAERRISAFIQDRLGPNRVGIPFTNIRLAGLGQPIADAVKFLLKEDFTPSYVNKFYFWLAPCLALVPLISIAVVPFGSTLFGEPMVIANIDNGVIFIFAIASIGVYSIVLAGWSSNSKYSFLGSVRSASQMISYELSLGLSLVPVLMTVGTLNLQTIVQYQVQHGWSILPLTGLANGHGAVGLREILLWIPMLISFVVFTVAIFAETNRLPFDLPESETELVAGYHTEYSSMKFALFFLGEYAAMITGCALITTLFLGGWSLPFVPDGSAGPVWGVINIIVFFTKVIALLIFFIFIRWTLPRFRYDQLMRLGWIFFFEIALVNIFITAAILALT